MNARRLALSAPALLMLGGCAFRPKPGVADLPPLPPGGPGVYADINPRWSNDGARIAFLRSTPDRRLQLFVADSDLSTPTALLESELVCPDRPYDSQAMRYSSPDTLAWSPDNGKIAFERAEWFKFDDGQRLPGTGLWSFELRTGRVSPLALHPKRYTDLYYYYHDPAWSPDGRYVAFVAEGINGQRLIGIRTVPVENPKEVAPRFDNYSSSDWPVWRGAAPSAAAGRPPQPVLAYTQAVFRTQNIPATAVMRAVQPGSAEGAECRELWRMSPAAMAARPDRRRAAGGAPPEPRIGQPVWSPDGTRLAFTLTDDAIRFDRYRIWVFDARTGRAAPISPADGSGYLSPVWIDGGTLGTLRPEPDGFAVVSIDCARPRARRLGRIASADCDWSPDRTRIVYALPPADRAVSGDDVTTLRFFETGLRARRP